MSDASDELDKDMFVNPPGPDSKWKRLNAEKFLLTFPKQTARQIPQNPGEGDTDGKPRDHLRRILEFYEKKYGPIDEYVIAWEKHDPDKPNFDPHRPYHLHIYIKFKNKRNVTSARYFDIPFLAESGSETHCNIKSVHKGTKDRVKVIRYCTKGDGTPSAPRNGWYVTNIDLTNLPNETDVSLDSKDSAYAHALDILRDESKPKRQRREEAHEAIQTKDPKAYVLFNEKVCSFINKALGGVDKSMWALEDFFMPPIPSSILNGDPAVNNGRPQCVIIWGPQNIGKTQYALAHGESPVLIRGNSRGLEGLDKINEQTDLVVFDDMSFKQKSDGSSWTPEEIKCLLDVQCDAVIDGRYRNRPIPAGVPRIFCVNVKLGNIFPYFRAEHHDAIDSRLHYIYYPAQMFHNKQKHENNLKIIKSMLSLPRKYRSDNGFFPGMDTNVYSKRPTKEASAAFEADEHNPTGSAHSHGVAPVKPKSGKKSEEEIKSVSQKQINEGEKICRDKLGKFTSCKDKSAFKAVKSG